MLNRSLFKHIDNSALIIFRVFFGLLITLESFGAIATGWVRQTLIEPEFTFSFIGLEWLQPLPGMWMYVYFCIMGIFGIGVMLATNTDLASLHLQFFGLECISCRNHLTTIIII